MCFVMACTIYIIDKFQRNYNMGGKSNFLFRVESSIYIHPKISQLLPFYMLHIEKNILCDFFLQFYRVYQKSVL